MSNEEINELFYSLQKECASRAAQIAPTWEDIDARQAQTSTNQQVCNFGGVNSFNNAGCFSQPHIYRLSYNHSGCEYIKISPMDIHVCEVKKVQVPTIKNNSANHLMKSYFLL